MPDPNQNDPNQNSTQTPTPVSDVSDVPSFAPIDDLPPMPVDSVIPAPVSQSPITDSVSPFEAVIPTPASDSGSAAPIDDIPPVTSAPKKKFGTGKIVATILGLFLLVGGVVAGVTLIGQKQVINEKAAGSWKDDCACGVNATGTACMSCAKPGTCIIGATKSCGTNGTQSCITVSGVATWGTCIGGGGGGTTCPDSDCNIPENTSEAVSCTLTSGNQTYCCPSSKPLYSDGKCIVTSISGDCSSYEGGLGKCYVPAGVGVDPSHGTICNNSHWTTCAQGYVCSKSNSGPGNVAGCVPNATKPPKSTDTPNPTSTPTPTPGITAVCQNIKAYSATWVLLTSAQLSALNVGDVVNFCVAGSTTGGSFDAAKFTINGVTLAQTSTTHTGVGGFCQNYTIPAATTTFNITAQIHHVTLGWK